MAPVMVVQCFIIDFRWELEQREHDDSVFSLSTPSFAGRGRPNFMPRPNLPATDFQARYRLR
jgi:hypothetical protein